ncbi:MAG: HAD family phosphatase [Bacteroidales bacterium]|nr:HAD family phosphatase [Bacteroidales bacterium]
MATIKNLIFDLGGVIYDIRYENIPDAFLAHGVTNMSDIYTRTSQTREMDLFEEGLLPSDALRQGVRALANAPLTDQDVDDIFNAILIDIPAPRIATLLALKQKYRVILYSNTNDINYQFYTREMMREYGFDIFSRCFHAAYFSHIMHIRKPKPEGFLRILREQGLRPEETLFIDDNEPNLAGARAVGIQGLWLHDCNMTELFDDRFNLRSPR